MGQSLNCRCNRNSLKLVYDDDTGIFTTVRQTTDSLRGELIHSLG